MDARYIRCATRAYRKAVDEALGKELQITPAGATTEQVYSRGLSAHTFIWGQTWTVINGEASGIGSADRRLWRKVVSDAAVLEPADARWHRTDEGRPDGRVDRRILEQSPG